MSEGLVKPNNGFFPKIHGYRSVLIAGKEIGVGVFHLDKDVFVAFEGKGSARFRGLVDQYSMAKMGFVGMNEMCCAADFVNSQTSEVEFKPLGVHS